MIVALHKRRASPRSLAVLYFLTPLALFSSSLLHFCSSLLNSEPHREQSITAVPSDLHSTHMDASGGPNQRCELDQNLTPKMPILPQEILNHILLQVDDLPFLWIVCRTVSQAFRKEVEFIFKTTWLPETEIVWAKHSPLRAFDYQCRISRFSPDGQTAYLKVQAVETRKYLHKPNVLLKATFQKFEQFVDAYQSESGSSWFSAQAHAVT
jgi:hypothetical protein